MTLHMTSSAGETTGERSPGGELTSSSPAECDATELGLMESESSSHSCLSRSSGDPSSPPSPEINGGVLQMGEYSFLTECSAMCIE